MTIEPGVLYLVPTPIGNLGDMTFRGVEVLKTVDLILAEDTRTSGYLLKHYEINTPAQSFHAHNEHKKVEEAINKLKEGSSIAQISDAGTPGVSDPGFLLVREALANKIKIDVLPGATAFVPALIKSGFSCERFIFEGFLPHKKGRQSRIELLREERRTTIFYESPHRLLKTLNQFQEILGNRRVSVSRELTKKFEETVTGQIEELISYFGSKSVKGEFVIVLEGLK
ncbi:MAG: 16S rRNA (cytidine(1402)-2'-O)-methyltransferase [Bacteroidota bacterium]